MGEQALKDHFAGLALQGLLAGGNKDYGVLASNAYYLAEKMLKEREKKEDGGGDE